MSTPTLEYQRAYREKNREKMNRYWLERAHENPERTREIRRRSRKKVREMYSYFISQLFCEDCGRPAEVVKQWSLHFHHRDPHEMKFRIGLCDRSWDAILKESEKCDVLCCSCHMKRHFALRKEVDSGR